MNAQGFALDVMHQFDEGVAKFLLEQLLDKENSVLEAWRNVAKMDRLYRGIVVPGHHNRNVRSLRQWKMFKAHELRFVVQHALPLLAKDFVDRNVYRVYCLASRIAFTCTKDVISTDDIDELKLLCDRFMIAFQESFGIRLMKFSIHLVSHLWYAVQLYGPLHVVSCYGPEDHIGRITRKIKGQL